MSLTFTLWFSAASNTTRLGCTQWGYTLVEHIEYGSAHNTHYRLYLLYASQAAVPKTYFTRYALRSLERSNVEGICLYYHK